jgi:hypothetical protein
MIKYESYEAGCAVYRTIYLNRWDAQTFTPGTAHSIVAVKLYLKKDSAPATDLVVDITATDGAGKPSGAALTSGTISSGDIGAGYAWVTCDLTPYALSDGTKYAIVCHTAGGDEVNHYLWCYDANDATYTNGDAAFSSDGGSSWDFDEVGTSDFLFSEWGVGGTQIYFLLA